MMQLIVQKAFYSTLTSSGRIVNIKIKHDSDISEVRSYFIDFFQVIFFMTLFRI